jgi:hypothetical protein
MVYDDAYHAPTSAAAQAARLGLGALGRAVSGFRRRLLSGGHPRIADLPDDLRADLGLEVPRGERPDAFWECRWHSVGRDLPF